MTCQRLPKTELFLEVKKPKRERRTIETLINNSLVKESLSTTVLCALLFLFFPRFQLIARPATVRQLLQAEFYDKAGALTREIIGEIWKKIQTSVK